MKSQVSLLGLTVGDYFRLCNWQQLPPASNNPLPSKQAKIATPARPVVISALTVEAFFKLCNWQLLPQLEPASDRNNASNSPLPLLESDQGAAPTTPTALPCLTVNEFFSLCNWHSLPPEVRKTLPPPSSEPIALEPLPVEPLEPLAQRVQIFFQMIPWDGSPKIGRLPQKSPVSELIAPPQTDMNLNDLSKLF